MKTKERNPVPCPESNWGNLQNSTPYLLNLAIDKIEEALAQYKPDNFPCVYLCGEGDTVTLTPIDATGPNRKNIWLCLLKIIRSFSNGNVNIMIQESPRNWESRVTPRCPEDILNKMIDHIELGGQDPSNIKSL